MRATRLRVFAIFNSHSSGWIPSPEYERMAVEQGTFHLPTINFGGIC